MIRYSSKSTLLVLGILALSATVWASAAPRSPVATELELVGGDPCTVEICEDTAKFCPSDPGCDPLKTFYELKEARNNGGQKRFNITGSGYPCGFPCQTVTTDVRCTDDCDPV